MGNCTGVCGACVGEDQPVKKIDQENMKKAMAANHEFNMHDISLGEHGSMNHYNSGAAHGSGIISG
jgi:hypothetical protein